MYVFATQMTTDSETGLMINVIKTPLNFMINDLMTPIDTGLMINVIKTPLNL